MVDDPVGGKIAKQIGMERALRAANPLWWQFMMEVARETARAKPFFFTDDLERIRQERQGPTTHENRAIGPLMIAAKNAGYCVPTDRWAESSQRVNHGRFMRVWYSLIYTGPKVKRPRSLKVIDPRQYDFLGGMNP